MVASQFTAYEVFSILSGICLVVVAVLPGMEGRERFWSLLAGAFFIGYGLYVAQQTSGTWYFPVWIFIIPVGAVIYGIISVIDWASEKPDEPRHPPAETLLPREPVHGAEPQAADRIPMQQDTAQSSISIPEQPGVARSAIPTGSASHGPGEATSPAGWHPDPYGASTLRYWNGSAWTAEVR